MSGEGDRRRHQRLGGGASAVVEGPHGALAGVVIDVSAGGLLLELLRAADAPALGERARITVTHDGTSIVRAGRAVRLRLAGRDKGLPMTRACAWIFDDGNDEAERALSRLLGASLPFPPGA